MERTLFPSISATPRAQRGARGLLAIASCLCLVSLLAAEPDPAALKTAEELYNQHKLLRAQQAFEALATTNPSDANIQFFLGQISLQREEGEKAVAYMEKAVALSPNSSRMHLALGDAYGLSAQKAGFMSQLGLARKCRGEYEKAVETDPRNIEARWGLMEYYVQAPSIVGGGMDKARVQAQEIKKLDGPRGSLAAGTVDAADKKFDLAFSEFADALKAEPGNYAANYQYGRLAAQTGQNLEEGLSALRRCLGQVPPRDQPGYAAADWRIGNILELKGDKAGARLSYEAALKVDPRFSKAIESLKKLNPSP